MMVRIRRCQKSQSTSAKKFVDVTVKSARGVATLFAPAWDMVMGHKRGDFTDEQYTTRYRAILDTINDTTWKWLHDQAEDGEVIVVCYCPRGFCHTNILAKYAAFHFPDWFQDYTSGSEDINVQP